MAIRMKMNMKMRMRMRPMKKEWKDRLVQKSSFDLLLGQV